MTKNIINDVTEYEMLSYYQSVLRTMGVYMTIGFTALVYSRFYRQKDKKSKIRDVSMIIISCIFNIVAHLIGAYLLEDIKIMTNDKHNNNHKYDFIKKWLHIIKLLIYVNYVILSMFVLTLFDEIKR